MRGQLCDNPGIMRRTPAVFLLCATLLTAQEPQRPIAGFLPDSAKRELELEAKFDQALNRQNLQQWMKRMSAKPHHVGSPAGKCRGDHPVVMPA